MARHALKDCSSGASKGQVPEDVKIVYRKHGDSHVFTSPDLPGLVVGAPDLRRAYDQIASAVSALVEVMFDVTAEYRTDQSFEKVSQIIEDSTHAARLLHPIMKAKRVESGGRHRR